MPNFLADIVVSGLPQDLCLTGSTADIIKQIAAVLKANVPSSISNVWSGNSEPPSPSYVLWVRQDNSGNFLGLYAFSEGSWVQIVGASVPWTPYTGVPTPSGAMTFTPYTFAGEYAVDSNNTVYVTVQLNGVIGGTPSDSILVPLPIAMAPGAVFNTAGQGNNSTNLTMWLYGSGNTTNATWAREAFSNFVAGNASAYFNFFYKGDL